MSWNDCTRSAALQTRPNPATNRIGHDEDVLNVIKLPFGIVGSIGGFDCSFLGSFFIRSGLRM